MKKLLMVVLVLVIALVPLSGCGSDYKSSSTSNGAMYDSQSYRTKSEGMGISTSSSYYNDSYDYEDKQSESKLTEGTNVINTSNGEEINYEKLVYRANISLETVDFDTDEQSLNELIRGYNGIIQSQNYDDTARLYSTYDDIGGYISSKHTGYRTLNIVCRIPTEDFYSFMNSIGGIGHTTSKSVIVDNISQQYYNTKAYLESYQNQLNNLQKMYDEATTIQEMMEIESRISDVQAEIMYLSTKIQTYDMDVAYSTITISLREVIAYSKVEEPELEETFWDRLKLSAKRSMRNLKELAEGILFWLMESIWALLLIAGIVFVIIKIIKVIVNKHRNNRQNTGKEYNNRKTRREQRKQRKQRKMEQKQNRKQEQLNTQEDTQEKHSNISPTFLQEVERINRDNK